MLCEKCGTPTPTDRSRFCSRKCMPSQIKKATVPCPKCGKLRKSHLSEVSKLSNRLCQNCSSDKLSGPDSPTWKGGHKHWSPGRFGKDKEGLSWKVQRQLAWERDSYECQHCHEKKGRKPDVHHINPFRVSQSHALTNLICLCQKCHLTEEAKTQEMWGVGAWSISPKSRRKNPYCSNCDRLLSYSIYREVEGKLLCNSCKIKHLISKAVGLKQQGKSSIEISKILNISRMTAYYYSMGVASSDSYKNICPCSSSIEHSFDIGEAGLV